MSKLRIPIAILFVFVLAGAWYVLRPLNPWDISKRYPVYLVVDRSEFMLYYLEKGQIKQEFPVVVGKARTRTPLGKWKVGKKTTFDKLGIYGFQKLQLDRLEGTKYVPTIYAIHGTNHEEFLEKMPRMFSNGCVRLYNKDIAWMWARVPKGTPVEVVL
ncbi:MAG: L,D-transpeptidase [Actinomycetia bacterium]|nr:L,D-transpeptidase [Actinomycetes bacterium]